MRRERTCVRDQAILGSNDARAVFSVFSVPTILICVFCAYPPPIPPKKFSAENSDWRNAIYLSESFFDVNRRAEFSTTLTDDAL